MFPSEFEYYRADNVNEALMLIQKHEGAKLLAGGHSLIPMMKLRLAQPAVLIDIGRVAELTGVSEKDESVLVGALTTHAQLAASDILARQCPMLAEAALQIADPQVRNKGTIGGNLAHADPASDLPAVACALGATIHLRGPDQQRQVPAPDFFTGLLTTDLKEDEILTAIEFPRMPPSTGSCYLKCEHPASGYAVCGAAALLTLDGEGKCSRVRLFYNAVSPTPHWASSVEGALAGEKPADDTIDEALNSLNIAEPLGDTYASGEYRVALARVYGRRALKTARDRAAG